MPRTFLSRNIEDGNGAPGMLLPGGGADGDTSTQYTLLETATGTLPMPTSGVLKVNPGQAGVYRVRYSPELLAKVPFVVAVDAQSFAYAAVPRSVLWCVSAVRCWCWCWCWWRVSADLADGELAAGE
jgi:hypothetical protein